MGYDMYLVKSVECPDKEAADAEWNAALAARALLERPPSPPDWKEQGIDPFDTSTWPDSEYKTAQLRVEAASERMYKADLNYFRLNIWGMSRAREIMDRLGMLVDAKRPMNWPEWDYDKSDHEPYECEVEGCEVKATDDPYDVTALTCAQFREKHDQVLRWTPLEAQGILVEKLCSNDGWIVLPSEIKEALTIYGQHSPEVRKAIEDETPWWTDWLKFLSRAAHEGDGFKVH